MLEKKRIRIQTACDQLIPLQVLPSAYKMNLESSTAGTDMFDETTVIYCLLMWADFDIVCWQLSPNDTEYQMFYNQWQRYLDMKLKDLQRIYDAAYAQYNPIENYNMIEQGLDGRKEDKTDKTVTPSGKTTVKQTHTGSETVTDTAYKNGLGSGTGDGVQTDKMVSKRDPSSLTDSTETSYTGAKTTDVTTPSNTVSGTFDGQTVGSYHEVTEHNLKRAGNIGSMSTQTMINQEWGIRSRNLLHEFIQGFVDMFGMYVGGV